MLNQIILVGRLTETPSVELNRNDGMIHLAIPRPFKNEEGEYETDFIDCELKNSLTSTTSEYCKKGDIVGVKGRLESRTIEKENGTIEHKLVVLCEKLTFLSSHSGNN